MGGIEVTGYTIPPALTAIRRDADRVAPGRSHASDGTIGDQAHAASTSDHNPAPGTGIVHAVDITNDPAHGMDTWAWAQRVADRIRSGQERRVKYLVSNDGQKDVIFNPSVSPTWRQNGSVKQDHRSHLHVSILYTMTAESDTTPFFVGPGTPTPPTEGLFVNAADIDLIRAESNRVIGAIQTTLREAIVPSIVAGVTAAVSSGTGATVDTRAVSKAVADELSARLQD